MCLEISWDIYQLKYWCISVCREIPCCACLFVFGSRIPDGWCFASTHVWSRNTSWRGRAFAGWDPKPFPKWRLPKEPNLWQCCLIQYQGWREITGNALETVGFLFQTSVVHLPLAIKRFLVSCLPIPPSSGPNIAFYIYRKKPPCICEECLIFINGKLYQMCLQYLTYE